MYQGILKSKTDATEINVAVKTLPELSTNQGSIIQDQNFYWTSTVQDQSLHLENERGEETINLVQHKVKNVFND